MTPASRTRRPPTSHADRLKLRGAGAFREAGLFGEAPGARSAALGPDGDLLALGGSDGAIRLWRIGTQSRVAVLRTVVHQRSSHEATILALAFRHDGLVLASSHVDGAVHLWHVGEGLEIDGRLRHEEMATSLAFSPDGVTLASGGLEGVVKLWDLRAVFDGEARREMLRQPHSVTAVAFSPDGQRLACGLSRGMVRVLAVDSQRVLATLRGPVGAVHLLAIDPSGKRLIAASQDRALQVFDLGSGEAKATLSPLRRPVAALSFLPGGQHVAIAAQDNAIRLWDMEAPAPMAALWGGTGESFVGVAAVGDGLVAALADGRIRVWAGTTL